LSTKSSTTIFEVTLTRNIFFFFYLKLSLKNPHLVTSITKIGAFSPAQGLMIGHPLYIQALLPSQDCGPVGLTPEELDATRNLMQDFLESNLLPFLERRVRALNGVVSTRSRGKLNKVPNVVVQCVAVPQSIGVSLDQGWGGRNTIFCTKIM
jgi:hypothetical protein